MKKLVLILMVLAIPALASAGTTWYDTFGFEPGVDPTMMTPDFTLTPLNGQGNWPQAAGPWAGVGNGPGGVTPMVVFDPLALQGQCVELNVGDTQGDQSGMDIGINDPLAAGYQVVTVSFDILRLQPATQNLWWYWWDAGTPTYGLQWDLAQATLPFGWNPGAGQAPNVVGTWANLTMTWDFTTMTTSSWYNGVAVDVNIPMPGDITTLTGWGIWLQHDNDSGKGSDVVWIDNFAITVDAQIPEPSMFLLAGFGLLPLLRRKK
ncbi:MAG: PEP-CTERM sorting domain-containing protein [Verrucomicrobia bacterium]|nr:PEP-CTERM sorting domain-containing protein [Verrucomicrobiota bacterium]